MIDFATGKHAVRRDLDAMLALLDDLPDERWATPTRCPEWTVRDLIDHVANVADVQADAFGRSLAGSTETPAVAEATDRVSAEVHEALRSGRDRLVAALDAMTPEAMEGLVPLPFSTLPASIAIVIPLIEYGFHRNDLEWALGDETPVPPDVASTTLEMLPGFIPMLETVPADGPLAYTLEAPSSTVTIVFRDGSWSVGEADDAPVCIVRGDDSAVALFALGRITADHPSLELGGATQAAAHFKHHFPGP